MTSDAASTAAPVTAGDTSESSQHITTGHGLQGLELTVIYALPDV
jgi:hypothetical protein